MSTPDSTPPEHEPSPPPGSTPSPSAGPVPPAPPPPPPRYGEYAPPGYRPPSYEGSVHTGTPAPVGRAARKPRLADVVVSCVLLAIGLIAVLFALLIAAQLPAGIQGVYDENDLGVYKPGPEVGGYTAAIAISQIVLYLVALAITIPLMIARRISFYVPLIAGALAAIVFWALLLTLLLSDPQIADLVRTSGGA